MAHQILSDNSQTFNSLANQEIERVLHFGKSVEDALAHAGVPELPHVNFDRCHRLRARLVVQELTNLIGHVSKLVRRRAARSPFAGARAMRSGCV